MTHILAVALLALLYGYAPPNQDPNQQETVATTSVLPGEEGLDLTALTALAKQCRNAQELEQQLNTPGSINNLDLDGDGVVDYIHVKEYANGNVHGFSLYVDKGGSGNIQEVATVEITQQQNTANVVVVGNQ